MVIFLFHCTEGTDNIPDRSVRGDRGGKHGDTCVDRDIEDWQTITHEILHNAPGHCW